MCVLTSCGCVILVWWQHRPRILQNNLLPEPEAPLFINPASWLQTRCYSSVLPSEKDAVSWCIHIRFNKTSLVPFFFYTGSLFHSAALEQSAAKPFLKPSHNADDSLLPRQRQTSFEEAHPTSRQGAPQPEPAGTPFFLLLHHRDTQQSHTVTFQPSIAVPDIEWACTEDEAHLRLNHPSFSPVSGVFWQNCWSAVLLIFDWFTVLCQTRGLKIFDPFIWVYPALGPSGGVLL